MSGSVSAISSTPSTAANFLSPTSTSSATAAANGQQTDFLKLLMAQMQHQDPSSPTNATDYVTQMAQFASVQGITQLNQSITNLVAMQSLTQSVSLIGKTVTYANAAGQSATGTVSSVSMASGQPQLMINNTGVSLSQVQNVQATSKSAKTSGAASA